MKTVLLSCLALACLFSQRAFAADEGNTNQRPAVFAERLLEAVDLIEKAHVRPAGASRMVEWAIRGLYDHLGEKIPAPLENRLKQGHRLDRDGLRLLLIELRGALGSRTELNKGGDLTVSLKTALARLDPRSGYLGPKELEGEIMACCALPGGTVGVYTRLSKWGDLLVVAPIKGGPAYKAGLRADDRITHIIRDEDRRGDPLPRTEVTSTKTAGYKESMNLLTGEVDTRVKLRVEGEGLARPFEVELKRAIVRVEYVLGHRQKDNDEQDHLLDPGHRIGYVRFQSFGHRTAKDLESALRGLERSGLKGLILDLRFNQGGLLKESIDVAKSFLEGGLVVRFEVRGGRDLTFEGKNKGSRSSLPLVCLVNGQTASSAELLAAALQDHRRALVVGERTAGRGSVQMIQPLDEGEITITTALLHRPSGTSWERWGGNKGDDWGVKPDRVVPLTSAEVVELNEHLQEAQRIRRPEVRHKLEAMFRDRQLEVALAHLREQIERMSSVPARP